jgi:hypothetical protein
MSHSEDAELLMEFLNRTETKFRCEICEALPETGWNTHDLKFALQTIRGIIVREGWAPVAIIWDFEVPDLLEILENEGLPWNVSILDMVGSTSPTLRVYGARKTVCLVHDKGQSLETLELSWVG